MPPKKNLTKKSLLLEKTLKFPPNKPIGKQSKANNRYCILEVSSHIGGMKEQIALKNLSDFDNKSLLIVDDDNPFRERLARAMEKKGFEVFQAESVQKGIDSVKAKKPGFAVVDLRLGDGNGLEVVKQIQMTNNDSRIIMLTGYGNIPTAVAAIKEGAIDYLAKPADAEDVERALLADPDKKAAPPENPMSADRVKWEHIHRVFELCNRNVSETARRLKMHRRTLQRILSKRSPR